MGGMMKVKAEEAVRLVSPRLLGLITTTSEDGSINASPYSWIFPLSFSPPMMMVGVGKGGKRTQENAEREGEFVINLVSRDFGDRACRLEGLKGSRQLEEAGLTAAEPQKVKTKGIRESGARIECRHVETVDVEKADHVLLAGEVVAGYCRFLKGGVPDLDRLGLIMHVSGSEFRKVGGKVTIKRVK
jgi:flavin reductase (DIM6/NTAB) family NADH-FMN oxidoreductase RutF